MAFASFASNLLRRSSWSSPEAKSWAKLSPMRNAVSAAGSICLVDSLSEALRRGYVQQFGDRICLDPNGFLPYNKNPAVPSEYVNVLGDVVAHVKAVLARPCVRAIFVRGSTVSGNLLQDFQSDLDLVVFTEKCVSLDEKGRLREELSSRLRKWLQVGRADIRYLDKGKRRGLRQRFRISPTLQVILRHFATPIYGSRKDIGISDAPMQPVPHLAINIRNDMNTFERVMDTEHVKASFSMQLSAIQWLCKKCLRATAELAALRMGTYARDLLPCYQLGSEAFPEFADIILHSLLIACASPANQFLDMRKDDILQTGVSVALQFAEIVEELSIRHCIGTGHVAGKESSIVVSKDVVRANWGLYNAYETTKEALFTTIRLFKGQTLMTDIKFRRWPLPALKVKGSRFAKVHVIDLRVRGFGGSFNCDEISEPVVYRDKELRQCDGEENTRKILKHLLRSTPMVQCRIARGPTVTFCRSKHEWLEESIFTAPSVLVSLPVSQAVQRLHEGHELSNLIYDHVYEECVYIQSRAIPSLKVFEVSSLQASQIAQEERLWISCHGTVSTLHYDSSYSALYQRCGRKRLLLFPPCCRSQLGIYPLGHPLHRRGRVDLTRRDTIIFKEFWNECASKAIEVTLQPGDLLLFPPFWSHHTETVTDSLKELSISHTLRYVSQ